MSEKLGFAENIDSEVGYIQVSFQGGVLAGKFAIDSAWQPAVDFYSGKENLYAVIDLAGVEPNQIELGVFRDRLTISGRRKIVCSEHLPEPVKCEHLEIQHGKFARNLKLPAIIDPQKASASYKSGLLLVILPRLG